MPEVKQSTIVMRSKYNLFGLNYITAKCGLVAYLRIQKRSDFCIKRLRPIKHDLTIPRQPDLQPSDTNYLTIPYAPDPFRNAMNSTHFIKNIST
jgi:hypothetical protein